jgi:hypothetical protein
MLASRSVGISDLTKQHLRAETRTKLHFAYQLERRDVLHAEVVET